MAIEINKPAIDFERDVAIGIDLPMDSFDGSGFALDVLQSDTNPNLIGISLSVSLIGNEFDTRQIDVTIDNDNPATNSTNY